MGNESQKKFIVKKILEKEVTKSEFEKMGTGNENIEVLEEHDGKLKIRETTFIEMEEKELLELTKKSKIKEFTSSSIVNGDMQLNYRKGGNLIIPKEVFEEVHKKEKEENQRVEKEKKQTQKKSKEIREAEPIVEPTTKSTTKKDIDLISVSRGRVGKTEKQDEVQKTNQVQEEDEVKVQEAAENKSKNDKNKKTKTQNNQKYKMIAKGLLAKIIEMRKQGKKIKIKNKPKTAKINQKFKLNSKKLAIVTLSTLLGIGAVSGIAYTAGVQHEIESLQKPAEYKNGKAKLSEDELADKYEEAYEIAELLEKVDSSKKNLSVELVNEVANKTTEMGNKIDGITQELENNLKQKLATACGENISLENITINRAGAGENSLPYNQVIVHSDNFVLIYDGTANTVNKEIKKDVNNLIGSITQKDAHLKLPQEVDKTINLIERLNRFKQNVSQMEYSEALKEMETLAALKAECDSYHFEIDSNNRIIAKSNEQTIDEGR